MSGWFQGSIKRLLRGSVRTGSYCPQGRAQTVFRLIDICLTNESGTFNFNLNFTLLHGDLRTHASLSVSSDCLT